MQQLSNGKYLGKNTFIRSFDGIILTQNGYDVDSSSEWHRHENPYFMFVLKGGGHEVRKKKTIECLPGMLLFYRAQERHKNEKYQYGSQNFNIEFEVDWLKQIGIRKSCLKGGPVVESQQIKDLMLKILVEAKGRDSEMQLAVESLVGDMLARFSNIRAEYSTTPAWLLRIKELLHDAPCKTFALADLADMSGVHPVTISKLFPRFFGTTIGDYIRGLKLEKSLALLAKKNIPIETIARQCGFANHAHYSRLFKRRKGITPSQYRTFLFG